MNASSASFASVGTPKWLPWLERELAPTPGRGVCTLRAVVGVALVIVIAMTLEVPSAAVSALMVLMVTKRNLATTVFAGVLMIVGVTLAVGGALLALPYVMDRAELRVPVMALLLLGGMYLSRIFVIGPLAFVIGFVMALVIGTITTGPANGNLIVRACLWIWVAICYPMVVAVATARILPLPKPSEKDMAAAQPAAHHPKARRALFKPGAFTDPTHLRFALKVTLAAMFCYLVYTAVAWPGIHTAFITVCICALESTGASLRKMYLRIAGCLIGGGLGAFSLIYIVPHMEGIVSLLLLCSCVTAVAAWIALGSERISYAGIQLGFAFYMCVLQGYDPPTDLHVIRDRVVGILFGIITTSLVFRYLWPERATDRVRTSLAQLLRKVAEFVRSPRPEEREKLTAQFEGTRRLGEVATLELDRYDPVDIARKRRFDDLFEQAQSHFLAAAAAVPIPELTERIEISRRLQAEAETLSAST